MNTKYTIFLVIVVALVVDYSWKLRVTCFELRDFECQRNLERTTRLEPQQPTGTCKRLTVNLLASQLLNKLMGGRHEP